MLQIYHCVSKCCSVVFGVTLRLLDTNVSSSSPDINKHCHLPLTSVINSLWSVTAEYTALGIHSTRWSQILVQNHDYCLTHLNSTPQLGGFLLEYCRDVSYGITRMVWLPDGEKILKTCLFVSTESTNVTDRQTRRHCTTA